MLQKKIELRIDAQSLAALDELAAARGSTRSSEIRRLIRREVGLGYAPITAETV